ncbi:MAG: hypothetical protein HC913_03545 [Microscillaceae bacterium]|nr:hypothetical protein [Microscillaceae bacterium]
MKKQHKVYLLISILLYGLFYFPASLYAYNDSTRRAPGEKIAEAAAEGPQADDELATEYRQNAPLFFQKSPPAPINAPLAPESRPVSTSWTKTKRQQKFSQKIFAKSTPPLPDTKSLPKESAPPLALLSSNG